MRTSRLETIREQPTYNRNKRVVGAGALLLTAVSLVAGCAPSKSANANSQSKVSEQSTSTPYSQPTASSSPETSPSTVPSIAPSKTPETSTSGLTAEQLLNMKPVLALYDPHQPYGSVKVIQEIYENIQFAMMSGRTDFLSVVIGGGINSDLGTQYSTNVTQFQKYFQDNPTQRLNYRATPTNIREASPGSTTYDLIAIEDLGGKINKSAQEVSIAYDSGDVSTAPHWVLSTIHSVPIS